MSEFERVRDRDLLRQFRTGDREGFAELYRIHSKPVYRFSLYICADPAKASEITQDVFVWLVHHPDTYDPTKGELSSFLIGVARQLLRRRYSEERRWVEMDETLVAQERESFTESDVAMVRRAVAALPLRYREVVAFCDLQEKSYEEAATLLECAVGTVRSRLHRARSLLAKKLGKKEVQRCTA
ncbi:MAG: RNA polymerase sigma factor [Bryobacteraceae bacterium]